MEIKSDFSPKFGAMFQNKVKIGKLAEGFNKYTDKNVFFVKIEPNNINDINILEKLSENWKDADFAKSISRAACALKNQSKFYKNHEIYALTSQECDFEKLDDNKILGIIHTTLLNNVWAFIEHMQVNPKYINKQESLYKGVGTGILNSIKQMYSKISCFPAKGENIKNFYTKNGFYEEDVLSNSFVWYKDVMDMIFSFKL